MKNVRISTLGTLISAALAVSTVIIVVGLLSIQNRVGGVGQTWSDFESGPTKKAEHLNAIYNAIGFGGMLHQYKNYQIGTDRNDIITFQSRVRDIRLALDAYASVGINANEAAALDSLSSVIDAYVIAINESEKLIATGISGVEVSAQIPLDDAPAITALNTLSHEINKSTGMSADAVNTAVGDVDLLTTILNIGLAVLLGALMFVMVWFTRNRLGKRLTGLTQSMEILASGDLERPIGDVNTHDEIGAMRTTVKVFRENMVRAREMDQEKASADETREARRLKVDGLTNAFESGVGEMIQALSGATSSMTITAESMSGTAKHADGKCHQVSEAAVGASTSVDAVAASAEELTSSINEISHQVNEGASIASSAVEEISTASSRVNVLAEAAEKIGEVVALITDIADQTNLLALNATIEAARAGEAGKGFAVVASEVKNLATQTARATEDIRTQIDSIQEETTGTVSAIESIGSTIDQINNITSAIAAAVEEQGAATNEIARNVEHAASQTRNVTDIISSVTEAAGETQTAANDVLDSTATLRSQADALTHQVEDFLGGLKTA